MKKNILIFTLCCIGFSVFCADLSLSVQDIRIEPDPVSGIHLYIRQKSGVNSILLTETTKDPDGKENNYALRAQDWNSINGDEKRLLNGTFLDSPSSRYSIIDSTVQKDAQFGQAFHLYLPQTMIYGYPWSRTGEIKLGKGVFINLRAFEKKFADYAGAFKDNPFMLDLNTKIHVLVEGFNQNVVETFTDLAETAKGKTAFVKNPKDLPAAIKSMLEPDPKKNLELVFVIDATESMKKNMDILRKQLIESILSDLEQYKDFKIGLLAYKDYFADFTDYDLPVKVFAFTKDTEKFIKYFDNFKVNGGGDYPEAVYEALFASMEYYDWQNDGETERKIILIGDAEPHPIPKGTGKFTKDLVKTTSIQKEIVIDTIILSDPDRK